MNQQNKLRDALIAAFETLKVQSALIEAHASVIQVLKMMFVDSDSDQQALFEELYRDVLQTSLAKIESQTQTFDAVLALLREHENPWVN